MNERTDYGCGWERDLEDKRDFNPDEWNASYQDKSSVIYICGARVGEEASIHSSVDWRDTTGLVSDQGGRNSCVAESLCNCVLHHDYMTQRKADVVPEPRSPWFLWKVTRNLSGTRGNVGTRPRDAMKALALYGVPPNSFWNRTNSVDLEPGAFVYGRADNLVLREYRRIDGLGYGTSQRMARPKDLVLESMKQMLIQEIPIIGGYYSFQKASAQSNSGLIRYVEPERYPGRPYGVMPRIDYSHCVMFCGYDDEKKVPIIGPKNPDKSFETTGALLFKNSWGAAWGEDGYGWLPYKFVLSNLCFDIWALMKVDMLHIEPFRA